MNSNHAFELIERIASCPGKKVKEALVAAGGAYPPFVRILKAAYDPQITYNVVKLPPRFDGPRKSYFDNRTWGLIEGLASRALTGNAARDAISTELGRLTDSSAELLCRILTKDLRAGFTEGTVNRAMPGTIVTFDCALAQPYDPARATYPAYLEPKVDGYRTLAFVNLESPAPTVTFYTRGGKVYTSFEHLKQPLIEALQQDPSTEGHVLVVDAEVSSGSFEKSQKELRRKTEQATDAVLFAFDILSLEEFSNPDADDYTSAPGYEERRSRLSAVFRIAQPHEMAKPALAPERVMAFPAERVESEDAAQELYARWRKLGLEGAMWKAADGRYRKTRDYCWMKMKPEVSEDLVIVAAEPGKARTKWANSLGALVVDYNGVRVSVSGMPDKFRTQAWEAWLADVAAGALEGKPKAGRKFQLVGQIAEIVYTEITPDGSLRHPRFKRLRADKAK